MFRLSLRSCYSKISFDKRCFGCITFVDAALCQEFSDVECLRKPWLKESRMRRKEGVSLRGCFPNSRLVIVFFLRADLSRPVAQYLAPTIFVLRLAACTLLSLLFFLGQKLWGRSPQRPPLHYRRISLHPWSLQLLCINYLKYIQRVMHLFEMTCFCQTITFVIDYQYHLSKKTSLLHDYYSADCLRLLAVG